MESVWVFAEQPTTIHYGLQLYEYSISGNEVGKWIRISDVQKAPSASKAFLCTANLTDASHKIAFRMAQLEAGNKVTAWSPSIADQEKYVLSRDDQVERHRPVENHGPRESERHAARKTRMVYIQRESVFMPGGMVQQRKLMGIELR